MRTVQSAVTRSQSVRFFFLKLHTHLHSSSLQDREGESEEKAWKGCFNKTSSWVSLKKLFKTCHLADLCVCSPCRWLPEVKMHRISFLLWWKTWPVKTLRSVMSPASFLLHVSFAHFLQLVLIYVLRKICFCVKAFFFACLQFLCMILSHFLKAPYSLSFIKPEQNCNFLLLFLRLLSLRFISSLQISLSENNWSNLHNLD